MDQYRQELLNRCARSDQIIAEMIPIMKDIRGGNICFKLPDAPENTDSTITELIETIENKRKNHVFTYNNDGTKATIGVGDTTLDFAAGTIKTSAGNVSKMTTSLKHLQIDFLRSVAIDTDQNITIQLDREDKILVKHNNWFVATYQEFTKITLTASVSTEVFLAACTSYDAVVNMTGDATASIGREEQDWIISDKDTHFTGAIATNANEKENIEGLESNSITIESISIQSDQELNYRLWIFGTDGFDDTDLDDDRFMEFTNLDLPTHSERLGGANQYYFGKTNLNIPYTDIDGTNELHVALENLDAVAKNAGATGEVKIQIGYIPRR